MGQTVTGSITGQVTDPSGAIVVGAKVTALNSATGVKTAAQTSGSGVYNIRFLPIGSYSVEIEASGFVSQKIPAFALEINQTAKIDAVMKVGLSTEIVVQGDAHPILNTTDSSLGTQFPEPRSRTFR